MYSSLKASIFPGNLLKRTGSLGAFVKDNLTNDAGAVYSAHIHLDLPSENPTTTLSTYSEITDTIFESILYKRHSLLNQIDAAFGVFQINNTPIELGLRSNNILRGVAEPNVGNTLFMQGIGSCGRLRKTKVVDLYKEVELSASIYGSMKSTGVLLGPTEPDTKNTIFCSPGDSGAIWYNENFEAVGMHVAGHRCDKTNNILPFMYPITKVLEALDVTMLTPEDVANL